MTKKETRQITMTMTLQEATALKDEIQDVKTEGRFIPFIDNCPQLWNILVNVSAFLQDEKTKNG